MCETKANLAQLGLELGLSLAIFKMDIESEPDSSIENFWLGKLNINDNPTYEIMNRSSTISTSLLKPQRNSCNRYD